MMKIQSTVAFQILKAMPEFWEGYNGKEMLNIRIDLSKYRIVYEANVETIVQVIYNDTALLKRCDILRKRIYKGFDRKLEGCPCNVALS